MGKHNCDNCAFRKKYDTKPTSLLGRLWRWHINWCPGWKKYYRDLDATKKQEVAEKYNLSH